MAENIADAKRRVAQEAAALVQPGMRLGLGSGSTALAFVEALGRRVAQGLSLPAAVATSRQTEEAARAASIPLCDMLADGAPVALDLAVDGADEVDDALRLIKGGGASLLREKIAAAMARRFLVIVDAGKRVERLGRFPLPVEVVPFGWAATAAAVAEALAVTPALRMAGGRVVVTDNHNYLLDCPLGVIDAPQDVADRLARIPGVVEHGLFLDMADEVLVAESGGVRRILPR